ncbi:MAG: hypothetical protein ABI948_02485 [Thermoleophilia bacterium]
MTAPRSVFVLRRGDVVEALEEQHRQIEELSAALEALVHEQGHAWPAAGERAASAPLDEISAKLDRLLAESDAPQEPREVEHRQVYVSELGDLGEFRARRVARRGAV